MILKKYKKHLEYSYTFGAFATIELINTRPNKVIGVVVKSSYIESDNGINLYELCRSKNIDIKVNDDIFSRIADKENYYVIGIFKKYNLNLDKNKSHMVLVNPSNMGNMGTIIRTMIGFGMNNLAIISPGVDIFDPKVVRASMGAFFKINFSYYSDFNEYIREFGNHSIYTFMINGEKSIKNIEEAKGNLVSLVFGNEATGLGNEFLNVGTSIAIAHSDEIDSLNLSIAVGIASYEFSKN
ncbi:TrmH family RNA methyltransferase [Clostridium sp. UBA6640]|uniref:TrmH family RNA methyltransferase n=1 Tax=Clostridium sp. UBA6640 TaxID=1946370 RepID=UPI0025BF06B7|nr:TrmH family RNA methyltransferase [Clostridium sp. UBA6640]